MSRLTPGIITLDKGLDLNTAKIAAPEGTLLDMLNYEQVDFMGQKRIDGYVRYDGSLGSYQDVIYRLFGDLAYDENTRLVTNSAGRLVGIVTGSGEDYVDIVLLNENLVPKAGQGISLGTVSSVASLKDVLTPQQQYETILEANEILRQRATTLPGPVAGLHWFNDRLYAVASVVKREIGEGYYPGGTYNDLPILKVDGNYAYLGTTTRKEGDVPSDVASLFQSRTEQQALDELGDANLYGWEFVHQGWIVPFKEGISLYGDFAALNQNRQGVGVQGPTNTTGTNGAPLVVTQRVDIAGRQEQVNGWKTTTDPQTYSLNASVIRDEGDNQYIYADAFFSWEEDTNLITAEGITTPTLVEYPASNTVEIEL